MKHLFIFSFFLIVIIGCSTDKDLLGTNHSFDYSIDQEVLCFCPKIPEARIFIAADTIASVISLSDSSLIPYQYWGNYRTIKGLFLLIASCDTALFDLIVEYDSLYGFPSLVAMYPKPSNELLDTYMVFRSSNYIKY